MILFPFLSLSLPLSLFHLGCFCCRVALFAGRRTQDATACVPLRASRLTDCLSARLTRHSGTEAGVAQHLLTTSLQGPPLQHIYPSLLRSVLLYCCTLLDLDSPAGNKRARDCLACGCRFLSKPFDCLSRCLPSRLLLPSQGIKEPFFRTERASHAIPLQYLNKK